MVYGNYHRIFNNWYDITIGMGSLDYIGCSKFDKNGRISLISKVADVLGAEKDKDEILFYKNSENEVVIKLKPRPLAMNVDIRDLITLDTPEDYEKFVKTLFKLMANKEEIFSREENAIPDVVSEALSDYETEDEKIKVLNQVAQVSLKISEILKNNPKYRNASEWQH